MVLYNVIPGYTKQRLSERAKIELSVRYGAHKLPQLHRGCTGAHNLLHLGQGGKFDDTVSQKLFEIIMRPGPGAANYDLSDGSYYNFCSQIITNL